MSEAGPLRLFLDSNVLTGGIVALWGLDKAVLSLCAARICRLVLAEIVRQEVEENLLYHATALPPQDAEQVLEDYATLLTLARPELIPLPDAEVVLQARPLIRHAADVPVLLSAMQSHPDWLLTHNTAHFTPAVAARTGLQTHVQGVRLNHGIFAPAFKNSRTKRCFFLIWSEGVDKNVPMKTEMLRP